MKAKAGRLVLCLGKGWFTQANLEADFDAALVHLGEGGLRLGKFESSCGRLLRDYLKIVFGLFGAIYIACFGGY